MNNYFSLTKEQQQKVLQAAENKIGLPGQAIEKDIWVTTILQIVFTMSCAEHLIFKFNFSNHLNKFFGYFRYHIQKIMQFLKIKFYIIFMRNQINLFSNLIDIVPYSL